MRRLLVLLFALALVAFGCGDDDDADPEADADAAEEINLTEEDLPDWDATAPEPDDADSARVEADMRECLGLPEEDEETADVDSDDFTQGQSRIASSVTFVPSEDVAEENLEAFSGDEAEQCVEDNFGRFLENQLEGATVDDLSVERQPGGDDLGDGSFAYQLTLELSAGGDQATLVADFHGALVGRAEIGLTALGIDEPVDQELQQELLEKMVDRAEEAA